MLEYFADGFVNLLTWQNMLYMLLGLIVGIAFGAIPGLNSMIAITLCLPITFALNVYSSFILLIALYIGATSGGLISAILINVPGTTASIATTFDGHPMAMNGQAQKALGTAIVFSCIGTILGIIVLVFFAPQLSSVALRFSPYDYFAVLLFSISLITILTGDDMLKGLISGFIGIFVAMIGVTPLDSFPRFTFGSRTLVTGFPLIPAIVGSFVMSEIIKGCQNNDKVTIKKYQSTGRGFGFSIKEGLSQTKNCIVSALLGIGIGILPGIGSGTSNLVAYAVEKRTSKHPEKFGTGIIDGIVAPETANNATIGGAMLPLLTLGIPGDGSTSLLLGAFIIQGLSPGPALFSSNPHLMYTIFAAMVVAAIGMVVVQYAGLRGFIKLLKVPYYILMPIILVLCAVGAYSANNNIFSIWTLFIMGMLGFLMGKVGIPRAPLVLGIVLGTMLERQLRSALQLSRNAIGPFLRSPVCLIFLIITAALLIFTFVSQAKKQSKKRAEEKAKADIRGSVDY